MLKEFQHAELDAIQKDKTVCDFIVLKKVRNLGRVFASDPLCLELVSPPEPVADRARLLLV